MLVEVPKTMFINNIIDTKDSYGMKVGKWEVKARG